jgi:hypothetical protein
LKITELMGEMIKEAKDWPPKIGSIRTNNKSRELPLEKFSKSRDAGRSRIPASTLEPSKGGTGRRLKSARLTFNRMKKTRIYAMASTATNRRMTEAMIARAILLKGPARAMKAVSRRGFWRL